MKKISIVVPMYNEEEAAPLFFEAISKVIAECNNYEFEVVAVNDGSKDKTLEYLLEKQNSFQNLVVVDLSRNWGHESAVTAGLKTATGNAVIPIDADLQDPPEIIPQMIEMWEQGYQVVNAQRGSRKKDTAFKKNTAGMYYKLLNKLSGKVKIPDNVANFRLIDRQVVDHVNNLLETNRVFRIQVPFVGFKTGFVVFDRQERSKGESKYDFKMMFNLALSSIVNLSTEPLKFSINITLVTFALFFISAVTEFILYMFTINGWHAISPLSYVAWLIANVVLFVGGLLLLVLSAISIYLSQTVEESRRRPTVIINKVYKK